MSGTGGYAAGLASPFVWASPGGVRRPSVSSLTFTKIDVVCFIYVMVYWAGNDSLVDDMSQDFDND